MRRGPAQGCIVVVERVLDGGDAQKPRVPCSCKLLAQACSLTDTIGKSAQKEGGLCTVGNQEKDMEMWETCKA